MISKELLSEVTGLNIHYVQYIIRDNTIMYSFYAIGEKRKYWLTLYELTHKCKQWAFNTKDCMFDIRYHTNSSDRHLSIMTYGSDSRLFCGATEYDVVFKLCEWLLQKDNK